MRRLLCAAGSAALLAGCGADGAASASPAPTWKGAEIVHPAPTPDVTLTDTAGRPFHLRSATAGRVLLLYFGYTHCPDACPTDMAALANAMKLLSASQRSAVTVAFVTTDPGRDTGPVLRAFLDRFDPSFIGLTGTPQQIAATEQAAGVTLATPYTLTPGPSTTPQPPGAYFVDHAAFILAYSEDGLAHEAFPGGVPVNAEANDIAEMADGAIPFS